MKTLTTTEIMSVYGAMTLTANDRMSCNVQDSRPGADQGPCQPYAWGDTDSEGNYNGQCKLGLLFNCPTESQHSATWFGI